MQPFLVVFPLQKGKEEGIKAFAKEVEQRRREFDASEKRLGVPREVWALMSTPQGSEIVIYFESKDFQKTLTLFAGSKNPFDVWFKSQVKDLTGVDLNAPPPSTISQNLLLYGY